MLLHYDIAILGGGPAGSAVALSLRKHAPELSVVIIESSAYDRQRIGETLPPTVQPLLKQLGVWESFLAEAHLPAYGTCSAWGSERLESNEFLYGQHGRGWHLDRKRFDAMLARESESRGVALLTFSTLTHSERLSDKWRLTLRQPDTIFPISARFVVDATGKTAAFATRHGARKQLFDQLLGAFVFFNCDAADTFTMVEACEDGWWYSALLPETGMVAAWMSDADVVKQRGVKTPACWFEQLQKTTYTKHRLLPAKPLNAPTLHAAASHRLDRFAGDGWLAVGDAATSFDPLSSQGVLKALRTGALAAYAVCDVFQGKLAGLEKYEQIIAREFEAYLKTRAEIYGQEQRWPNSPFWKRRSSERKRSEYRLQAEARASARLARLRRASA